MTIVAAADYKVTFPETFQHAEEIRTLPESWKEKVDAFMAQPEIVVLKKTKRSEKEVDIKIFSVTRHANSKRLRKRHDHMRTVSGCKCDRYLCAPDCFLEITHHVQVSNETHDSIFTEFNSYFQHRHLLSILRHRSRNISYDSSVLLRHSLPDSILSSGILSLRRYQ